MNCYNQTGLSKEWVSEVLLQSAKKNLQDCAFFGIVEEQQKTQFLFEKTMGIRFINNFRQKNDTHVSRLVVSEMMMKKILDRNRLDIELYQFAKDLFLQRVAHVEKILGYTVDDYFNHIRVDSNGRKGNSKDKVAEYDNEYDIEGDEDVEEMVGFYPNKRSYNAASMPSEGSFRQNTFRQKGLR